jgi:CP family cyanate transporter-like MFS transporter
VPACSADAPLSQQQSRTALVLLWLAGGGLRFTVLAVPPVIPLIQAELGLSGTQIGILSGLPVLLFAVAALPGSLLIARVGAVNTLVAGLLLAGVGSALRGAASDVAWLYAATVVLGVGIAIMQPSFPPLVRQWLPTRIGFGTAVYTNGLLVGEFVPVAIMLPVVLPLLGNSWRAGLVAWSVPMVILAALVFFLAPRSTKAADASTPSSQWWPDWRDSLIWRLGFIFASANGVYFGVNAFLPGYLTYAVRPDLISIALTAFNFAQFPASILLLLFARKVERRIWPFVTAGLLSLFGLAGIVATASYWTVFWAALVGFASAAGFALGLTLPPFLSAPSAVGRVSAAMFTVSYSSAVAFAVLGGAAWDFFADPRFAFLPLAICGLPMVFLTPTLEFGRKR